jgi:hypothetical protein
MLGEQFMVGEEICGAVISIRYAVSICCPSLISIGALDYLNKMAYIFYQASFYIALFVVCLGNGYQL